MQKVNKKRKKKRNKNKVKTIPLNKYKPQFFLGQSHKIIHLPFYNPSIILPDTTTGEKVQADPNNIPR